MIKYHHLLSSFSIILLPLYYVNYAQSDSNTFQCSSSSSEQNFSAGIKILDSGNLLEAARKFKLACSCNHAKACYQAYLIYRESDEAESKYVFSKYCQLKKSKNCPQVEIAKTEKVQPAPEVVFEAPATSITNAQKVTHEKPAKEVAWEQTLAIPSPPNSVPDSQCTETVDVEKCEQTSKQFDSLTTKPLKSLIQNRGGKILSNSEPLLYLKADISAPLEEIAELAKMKFLQEINLAKVKVLDLEKISNLCLVKKLNLLKCNIKHYCALSNFLRLESIKIDPGDDTSGSLFSDLRPLTRLENLAELELMRNKITSIEPLSKNKELKRLLLAYNEIGNIEALSQLTNLKILGLAYNQIKSINALSFLTSLRDLDLSYNPIADIQALSSLKQLETLHINQLHVSDFSPLSSLKGLKELYIDSGGGLENQKIRDLKILAPLSALTTLRLSNNDIADLSPLKDNTALKYVYLDGNKITNLEPLGNLFALKDLFLGSNKITDISPLLQLDSLQYLDLNNNNLNNIQGLLKLKKLGALTLTDNPLSFYSLRTLMSQMPITRLNYDSCRYTEGRRCQVHHLFSWMYVDVLTNISKISFKGLGPAELDSNPWLNRGAKKEFLLIYPQANSQVLYRKKYVEGKDYRDETIVDQFYPTSGLDISPEGPDQSLTMTRTYLGTYSANPDVIKTWSNSNLEVEFYLWIYLKEHDFRKPLCKLWKVAPQTMGDKTIGTAAQAPILNKNGLIAQDDNIPDTIIVKMRKWEEGNTGRLREFLKVHQEDKDIKNWIAQYPELTELLKTPAEIFCKES